MGMLHGKGEAPRDAEALGRKIHERRRQERMADPEYRDAYRQAAREIASELRTRAESAEAQVERLRAERDEIQEWADQCVPGEWWKIEEARADAAEIKLCDAEAQVERLRAERDKFDDEAERLGIAKEEWRAEVERLREIGNRLAQHVCDNEFDHCREVKRFKREWPSLHPASTDQGGDDG